LNVRMAYGHDVKFRERVVAAHAAGKGGVHALAEVFGIGYRTVQRWLARQRATGSVAPAPGAGGWKSPVDPTVLTTLIREAPDSTAAELCWEYNRRVDGNHRTSVAAIGRARARHPHTAHTPRENRRPSASHQAPHPRADLRVVRGIGRHDRGARNYASLRETGKTRGRRPGTQSGWRFAASSKISRIHASNSNAQARAADSRRDNRVGSDQ
jgi:transposase